MKFGEFRKMSAADTDGKEKLITYFQNANDISKELRASELESRGFAKKLVPFFKKNDAEESCLFVWRFLRKYIQYDAEPKEKQTGKTIQRFFADKIGDCKHYSISSVGILNQCGIPAWFAIVRQGKDKTKFHAYCCALVDGRVIVVDPCRTKFNSECRFVKKYNVPPIKK